MALTETDKRLGKLVRGMERLIKIQQKSAQQFQKQNKVVKQHAKQVEAVTQEMYSLVAAEEIAIKTTDSLARKFAKAANNQDGYGKTWTMFSRILSGSPLWKMQNYVRAVGQAMDGFMSKTEEAAKATNEQAQAFSELQNQIDAVAKQEKILAKGGKKSHDLLMKTNQEYANMFNALTAGEENQLKIEEAKRVAKARTLSMYKKTHKRLLKNIEDEGKP